MADTPDSQNGPPLWRPVPVRPFKFNLKEPTPPEDESLPHTPQPGSNLNLDWLNHKLMDSKNKVRSDSGFSLSRAQSVKNLTSSTLMGIYEPSDNDLNTPWENETATSEGILGIDDSTDIIQTQRVYPARRASIPHHPVQPAQTTTTSLLYSSLRALLLSSLGIVYGIVVSTVRESRSSETFRMEHVGESDYNWGYMAFWGASGLILGCLLPWVDGLLDGKLGNGDMVETESDVNNGRRKTDWALAVRGMGIFIGIAYAIRKCPWDSTLQVSLSLALVNPALWYFIDGSIPGFIVSSVVGVAGSAFLTGLQPDMVPVPAMLSFPSGHHNSSNPYFDDPISFGGLAGRQQTLATGIWTLNVLFCCCVVFGNVGRWLAINKYGTKRA